VQAGDVGGERREPIALEPAGGGITSNEEPTFTTMRRKSLSSGVFDMAPATA